MRRTAVLPVLVALLVGAAACGGDGAAQVDTTTPDVELASAVTRAQSLMPVDVTNRQVRELLGDLCSGTSTDAVGDQLAALSLEDQAKLDGVLHALDAGTSELCPDDIAPTERAAVAERAQAALPTTTAVAPAAVASSGTGGGSGGSTGTGTGGSSSSSNGAASTGSTDGGASSQSSGQGAVGSSNASGSGNQSTTNQSQSVGGGSSANSTTG